MDLAVTGPSWQAAPFLDRWCRDEFGPRAAPAVAAYYRAYFQAPGRYGEAEHHTLADNAYHNLMRLLLASIIHNDKNLDTALQRRPAWLPFINLSAAATYTREAEPRWAAARALALQASPLIPTDRRQFFQSHILTQLDIHLHSNRALRLAAEAWAQRDMAPTLINSAIDELRLVLAAMHAAEYGKWQGFYSEDRFVNVRKSLALAQAAAATLAGQSLPPGLNTQPFIDDSYPWIKAYQNGRHVDTR
jgi:hypothetical protein